jgi:internalin A
MRSRTLTVVVLVASLIGATGWIFWIKPAHDEELRAALLEQQLQSEQRLSAVARSVEKRDGRIVKATLYGVPVQRDLRRVQDATELEELGLIDAGDELVMLLDNHRRLRNLTLIGRGIGERSLPVVGRMHNLEELSLERTRVTDEGLVHLKSLQALRSLNLASTDIQGPGLKHLSSLPKLHFVVLRDTLVDDDGLSGLAGLSSVIGLHLSETRIRGPGLRHLAKVEKLSMLTLTDCQLTDLSPLGELEHLTALSLPDVPFPPSELESLAKLSNLRQLSIQGPNVTDAHLQMLTGLKQLVELNFDESHLTDAGLAQLETCSHLQLLGLGRGEFTDAAVIALAKSLPQTSIRYGDGKQIAPSSPSERR